MNNLDINDPNYYEIPKLDGRCKPNIENIDRLHNNNIYGRTSSYITQQECDENYNILRSEPYNLNIPKLSLKDKEKSITQNEIEIENEIEIDSTEGYPGKKYYPDVKFTRIDEILTNLNFLRTLGHGRIYRTSIDMWKLQPLFGFGLKSFRIKCWELSHFDRNRACANHAHNYYLELLSETGLIGVSLIIIFFLILLKNSFYYLIKHNHVINPEKYLFIPLFIIFFLEIWPIRSTGSFFTTGNTFFWLNIALLLSIYKKRSL